MTANSSKKAVKRILKVTIKHILDESPDTSWLGEYSNRPTSEFSIDRATDEFYGDLVSGEDWLQRIQNQLIDEDEQLDENWKHATGCSWRFSNNAECSCGEQEWREALTLAMRDIDSLLASETFQSNWDRREYRYFNPSFNYVDASGRIKPENTLEQVRKYVRQDYERMERIQSGGICFIGIRADAEIAVPTQPGNATIQKITSGGLWGIESDSEQSYIAQEKQNQLADLKTQLLALGFSKRAISQAFKEVKDAD